MKKTTLFAPLALTLALGLMTGCTAAAMNSSSAAAASDVAPAGSPSSTVSAGIAGSAGSDEYIAQADAENIALTDAGLTADSVSGMYGRLDYDDGRAVYDIEFWTDTAEYDYEIDAVSGEILSMDQDAENYTPPQARAAAPPANGSARTPPARPRWPTPAWPTTAACSLCIPSWTGTTAAPCTRWSSGPAAASMTTRSTP